MKTKELDVKYKEVVQAVEQDNTRIKDQVMVIVLRKAGEGNYYFEDGVFDAKGNFEVAHVQNVATPMLTIANLTARVIHGMQK